MPSSPKSRDSSRSIRATSSSACSITIKLTSVGGLSALTRTGGLVFSNNEILDDISPLNLEQIDGDFTFTDNPMLPTCKIEQLRDAIGTGNITGDVTISGNDQDTTC
jgi:hypothetical protein